ncbi:Phytochrome-like protein cph1 [Burkholderiales bacterium]|nr:Phytochrome-like protein cph1 [Burkholderiales bacterium]
MAPVVVDELPRLEPPAAGKLAGESAYASFLGLDEFSSPDFAPPGAAPEADVLADLLFDRCLATAPLRQLLAEGQWDGSMPQLECGRFGALLGRKDPPAPAELREAGHSLRRAGLNPGWVLAAYGHHLDALLGALEGGAGEDRSLPAGAARSLVKIALADAAQVLDAYLESQAERAAQAERQLRVLFQAMPAGVLVLNHELKVLRANVAFMRMFGWVIAREVLGRGVGEATRIGELPGIVDAVLLARGKAHDLRVFRQGEDGRRAYTCDSEAVAGEGGTAVLVMLRDVTERYRQREAAERLRAATDLSHDAMFLVDPQALHFAAVNATACKVLGYSRKELLALGPQDIIAEAEIGRLEQAYATLAAAGEAGEIAVARLLRRDGSSLPVELAQRALRVGEQQLVVVAARDLSERQEAESRLRQSEEMYRETFEHTAVGIAHVACDGRWLRMNERLCEIVGYSRDELLQKTFQDITHPEDLEADLEFVAAMLRGDIQRYSMEKRYVRKNGEAVWILLTVSLLRDEAGAPRHFIAVVKDIHAGKLAQEEHRALLATLEQRVAERTAALETANHDLEAFAYSVSHDLRAPLRSVGGFAKALEMSYRSALDELGAGYVQRLVQAVTRMDLLIEDLLRLARAGKAPVRRVPVDLAALADEMLHRLAAAEPQRRVHWSIATLPLVEADAGLTGVALENLLGNAWKFTAGRAVAHISLALERDDSGQPVFVVRDDGAGFPPERAAHLFQPFQRLHDDAEYPGSGIGLATVARVVERHGGRIWAEGRPNEGAAFRFTLGGQASGSACRE